MFSMTIEIKNIHVHHFIITNTLILLSKLIMYIIYIHDRKTVKRKGSYKQTYMHTVHTEH